MKADYIVACGIAWRKMADPAAAAELLEALQSEDQEIRLLAQTALAESGDASMNLLESAVVAGVVNPDIAGPCMVDILRARRLTIDDWTSHYERNVN